MFIDRRKERSLWNAQRLSWKRPWKSTKTCSIILQETLWRLCQRRPQNELYLKHLRFFYNRLTFILKSFQIVGNLCKEMSWIIWNKVSMFKILHILDVREPALHHVMQTQCINEMRKKLKHDWPLTKWLLLYSKLKYMILFMLKYESSFRKLAFYTFS